MNKLLHLNKYVKILLALLWCWMPWLAYPHRGGGHLPTQISVLPNRFLITMQYCFSLYAFLEALISIIFSQNPLKRNKAFLCAIGFKNWTCLCRKSAVFNMAAKLSKSKKWKQYMGNREKETMQVLKTNFKGVSILFLVHFLLKVRTYSMYLGQEFILNIHTDDFYLWEIIIAGHKNNWILRKWTLLGPVGQFPTVNIFLVIFCSHRFTKSGCFGFLVQRIGPFSTSIWCPRFYWKVSESCGWMDHFCVLIFFSIIWGFKTLVWVYFNR